MKNTIFQTPDAAFLNQKRKHHIPVHALHAGNFKDWLKKQPAFVKAQIEASGFDAAPLKTLIILNETGKIGGVVTGVNTPLKLYDLAATADFIGKTLSKDQMHTTSFYIADENNFSAEALINTHTGWGLAHYAFSAYKAAPPKPALVWSKSVNQPHVTHMIEAIFALRNLVNTPANDMGPDELDRATRHVAEGFKAKVNVIQGDDLLKHNFPLIHAVGKASPRAPRLIDLRWGKKTHPKITLVGKGVCFDTGGLDIKPSAAMRHMKKDMGGAAHALALAHLIMAHDLPVQLRVLIPAVENAVGGAAYRPGDIIKSRKGISIENTNTDAEGRLILADALTYACEDMPDLLIDFATLTGSARVALGPDIPPLFSNDDALAHDIQESGRACDDPVWPMPLWQPYRKHFEGSVSDIINSASIPGDLIYSALFLESFVEPSVPWAHLDVFAWEQTGKAGRPVGGADNALRAVFATIQKRYEAK